MRPNLRPRVVLLAVFALVLAGAGGFMARLEGASAAGGGPEMRLTANGCTADCSFATGESFTLAVDIVTAPAAGYVAIQSFIDYGGNLIYDIDGQPAETEIVWADLDSRVALRQSVGAGLVNHGGVSALIPPFLVSTDTGNFVEIKMTCSAGDTSTQVDLLPLGDHQARTVGAGFALVDGILITEVIPKVSGLLIHCGAGGPLDAPTPTAPPTSTPVPTSTPGPTSPPGPTLTLGPGFLSNPTPGFGEFGDATIGLPGPTSAVRRWAGDLNCDNLFTAIDATLILELHAALLPELPCPRDSDVNGDGLTNSVDAALILQFSAGLLPTLPP